jgi:hypothetical protein
LRAYNPSGGSRSFWVCGIQVTWACQYLKQSLQLLLVQ